MIEVEHQINATERQVGARMLAAGEARTVTISQTYDTTIEDLWNACTNPERVPQWFLPVSGDLRPGGRYHLEGNASGTIGSCDPPNGFTATWEYGTALSWIEVRITPVPMEPASSCSTSSTWTTTGSSSGPVRSGSAGTWP